MESQCMSQMGVSLNDGKNPISHLKMLIIFSRKTRKPMGLLGFYPPFKETPPIGSCERWWTQPPSFHWTVSPPTLHRSIGPPPSTGSMAASTPSGGAELKNLKNPWMDVFSPTFVTKIPPLLVDGIFFGNLCCFVGVVIFLLLNFLFKGTFLGRWGRGIVLGEFFPIHLEDFVGTLDLANVGTGVSCDPTRGSAATLPVPGVSCDPTHQNSMEGSTFSTHTRGQLRPYLTSV